MSTNPGLDHHRCPLCHRVFSAGSCEVACACPVVDLETGRCSRRGSQWVASLMYSPPQKPQKETAREMSVINIHNAETLEHHQARRANT